MARRAILLVGAALLGVFVLPPVPSLAGGGCHTGVTNGEGDTVEMRDACFTPSILRVDPGASVTFVNRDQGLTHNVGGNLWGHFEDMEAGDTFVATFDEAGIYPFACSYHPGMTGAILVGDGSGAGNGEEVTVAPYEAPAAAPQAEVVAADEPAADSGSSPVGWLATAAAGLVIGLGVGMFGRRRAGGAASGS